MNAKCKGKRLLIELAKLFQLTTTPKFCIIPCGTNENCQKNIDRK